MAAVFGLVLYGVSVCAAASVTLEDLVAEALAHNPEIHGSQAQWQMLVAKSQRVAAFDDPMLMFGIQNGMVSDPLAFDQDPQTAKVIGISQMFPFFGKRGLMRAEAAGEAEVARWSVEERKVELRQMVSEAWAQLAYVETSLRVVEKNIALLDDIGQLAEAAYKAGMGKQSDILRVQIERSRMEEMKLGLAQQRRSLQAMFTALLHRADTSEIVVEIVSGRDISVNFDMQTFASLQHGDEIVISRSPNTITFLHPEGWSYYHTLREKLHWHEYPSNDGKLK